MKNTVKKTGLLFVLVISLMLFAFSVSALEDDNKCGENVYWTFEQSTGELTISGEGAMTDYSDDSPFSYSGKIESVIIEDGVTTIGEGAFSHCLGLTSVVILDSVTTIGASAFDSCFGLTAVNIPKGVTVIDASAFDSCTGLTAVTVDAENEFYSSEDGVLFDKDKEELMLYPAGKDLKAYTVPDRVTAIGAEAFTYSTALESVEIPYGVTSIGAEAFMNCDSITEITLPNSVISFAKKSFAYMDKLETINFGAGLTNIYASDHNCENLDGCTKLKYVYLPDTFATTVQSTGNNILQTGTNVTMFFTGDLEQAEALRTKLTASATNNLIKNATFIDYTAP